MRWFWPPLITTGPWILVVGLLAGGGDGVLAGGGDGVHVAGQKRLKKEKSSNRKGGHLGCSESFDFNKHKSAITKIQEKTNSQGREQMHSILEPLAKSLRQKNYRNFMKTLVAFFAIRNLKTMKKL